MSLLPKDSELVFPHVMVIPASAGSGKTYTLSHRYVQFLLSQKISDNTIRNILAITFTKLAAKEMKERILMLLRKAALRDEKTLNTLSTIVSFSHDEIAVRSERLVDEILHNYSDFNVRTIDSFLTTVFKASAFELGIPPDINIEFDNAAVIEQAFRQYSQQLREGSKESEFIDHLVSLIESNDVSSHGFLWNPFTKIVREVQKMYGQFGKFAGEPAEFDGAQRLDTLKEKIISAAGLLLEILESTPLPVNNYFKKDIEKLAAGNIYPVAAKEKKKKYFNKYTEGAGAKKEVNRIFKIIDPLEDDLEEFMLLYAQTYYQPFVHAVRMIEQTVRSVKTLEGITVIDDVNRSLAGYLAEDIVPEVYFKLGDRISHFMIDEFQDTSPIQWKNLFPLIEETLSKQGSLFAVGDTKQSIYGFRGADWHIFKNLIDQKYFPSAPAQVLPLTMNYRSADVLVKFVKNIFMKKIQEAGLQEYAAASGLYNFVQEVPEQELVKGYVEVKLIEKIDDVVATTNAQSDYILSIINDCKKRGYSYGDIAVLTPANADVVEISSWLNQAGIPFLSLSTLDIRKRKIIGEIIAFLKFLDSPIDNLSFATFVLGNVFQNIALSERNDIETSSFRRKPESDPMDSRFIGNDNNYFIPDKETLHKIFNTNRKVYFYRTFQKHFPDLWKRYFDPLFSLVGYMPLYDIVSETYKTFNVFTHCREEESALVKLLECVKKFENSGNNSLKDFLSFSGEQGSDEWSIEVPGGIQAVRIMTVHKAKGLGFPVALILFKERRRMSNSMVMKEGDNGLSVLRVTKDSGSRSTELADLYNGKETEQTIDDLNKMYVALTRAQKEMYVVCVFKKKENLPAAILPEGEFGARSIHAEKEMKENHREVISSLYNNESVSLPVTSYEKIGLQETRRGDVMHNILANIEFVAENIETDIRSSLSKVEVSADLDIEKEIMALKEFLLVDAVREYFIPKEGRSVLREQDIVASTGRLFRMDRVIIDADGVTVVDFKTGSDEIHEKYSEQVNNYKTMLADLYPQKKISGALLYIDMRKVVPVQ